MLPAIPRKGPSQMCIFRAPTLLPVLAPLVAFSANNSGDAGNAGDANYLYKLGACISLEALAPQSSWWTVQYIGGLGYSTPAASEPPPQQRGLRSAGGRIRGMPGKREMPGMLWKLKHSAHPLYG